MADFGPAVAYVLHEEGGAAYTNSVNDRGGATKYGITVATLSSYRGITCSAMDIQDLGLAEAQVIYRVRYWNPLRLGEVRDLAVATAGLDIATLCGTACAAKMLQEVVGTKPDGIIGPMTLGAINGAEVPTLLLKLQQSFQAYVTAIATRDPTQRVWLPGWLCRAGRLVGLPLAMAGKIT